MKKFIIPVLLTSAVLLAGCQKQVDYVTYRNEAEKALKERGSLTFENATYDVTGYVLNDKNEKDNFNVHWFYNFVEGVPVRDAEKSTSTYVTMQERALVDTAILAAMIVKAEDMTEASYCDYYVSPLAVKRNDGKVSTYQFDKYGNISEFYHITDSMNLELKASYTFK